MPFSHVSQKILQLQEQIYELEQVISHAPDGHLICCHSKNYTKWYHSNGHSRIYIPKANRTLAESLAITNIIPFFWRNFFPRKKHWNNISDCVLTKNVLKNYFFSQDMLIY